MSSRINQNPRFTRAVVQSGCLADAPMVVVDVGASGGCPLHWDNFGNNLRYIGFEPNPDEFKKCQQTASKKIYPVGLGKGRELKTIKITRWPYSSSTIPFNMSFWNRFPNAYMFDTVRTEIFETIDFDSFCSSNGIDDVDVIKLDTEGSELEILKGGADNLNKHIMAVIVEVAFYPYQINRPLFADVDIFLRDQGFALYDLETMRLARSALPPLDTYIAGGANYGQVLAGDALYMIDYVGAITAKKVVPPAKIVKAVCLFELFNLHDSAIELLELAIQNNLIPKDFERAIDLLVPPVFDRFLTLNHYRSIFKSLPQHL